MSVSPGDINLGVTPMVGQVGSQGAREAQEGVWAREEKESKDNTSHGKRGVSVWPARGTKSWWLKAKENAILGCKKREDITKRGAVTSITYFRQVSRARSRKAAGYDGSQREWKTAREDYTWEKFQGERRRVWQWSRSYEIVRIILNLWLYK